MELSKKCEMLERNRDHEGAEDTRVLPEAANVKQEYPPLPYGRGSVPVGSRISTRKPGCALLAEM